MSISALPRWQPSDSFKEESNLHHFIQWMEQKGEKFETQEALWKWSVENTSIFWETILTYFQVQYDGQYTSVVEGAMPEAKWFEGISVSLAEHVFRNYTDARPALIFASENTPAIEMSWKTMKEEVSGLASFLQQEGVAQGDRVAAYLPCTPAATVGFLAANSLGALWSGCSPDFGAQSVIDRYAQIEPKVFIAVDSYSYGGKVFDRTAAIEEIVSAIPSISTVILITTKSTISIEGRKTVSWQNAVEHNNEGLTFRRVPFNHPAWILYSSGTTGLPKAIAHSTGGILLEHLKYISFHNDVHEGEKFFWYTSTGWMMWNYLQGVMLCGGIPVLYDGSPAHPDLRTLWQFVEENGIHHFGTSAGFILACLKAGINPGTTIQFYSLRSISSTGSTLPPEGFDWIYQNIKEDIWLASMSGGTDVCSAFVGGNPLLPVYVGEIQCRALGCYLEAWNEEGIAVKNEVGEMVITKPMPSMPVFFWKDDAFKRYRESYFNTFPGIWKHGDWISITSHNGVIIYGRSDATLNRGGIRIGTSEIYRAVDKINEIKDSLIVCIEKTNGEFYMPLFVVMKDGIQLTSSIEKEIKNRIRSDTSPRHVPDEILEAPDIPYTISGKKTETPVKKILMGKSPEQVMNAGALRNPESIAFFQLQYEKMKTLNSI